MLPRLPFKTSGLLPTVLVLITAFLPVGIPSVQAVEYATETRLNITSPKQNLYAAGGQVQVSAPVSKDLVVVGASVNVATSIERNLNLVGSSVVVNADLVGGTTTIAGGTVKLKGVFNEDVTVVAGQLDIEDALIKGDLLVKVGNLKLTNSLVSGDLLGTYNSSTGDLASQVKGAYSLEKQDQKLPTLDDMIYSINPAAEISVIASLLLICYLLSQRHRLKIRSIKLDKELALDFLAGLMYFVLPFILLVISIILQLYPLVLTIGGIIYLLFTLSCVFLPVYLANLCRNVWFKGWSIRYMILCAYLFLLLLNIFSKIIPGLDFLQIFIFLLALSNFGFVMRRLVTLLYDYIQIKHEPSEH
jgi:hypothetical protein